LIWIAGLLESKIKDQQSKIKTFREVIAPQPPGIQYESNHNEKVDAVLPEM
jgi:hypothetical protein